MLATPTVLILKSLSLAELKRFGDFVKSPYHNSTSSLEIIFDAVLKSYPDFNSKALKYENMAKKIFPEGEHKEKRVKNLYSEFGNLLRRFLGHEELNKNPFELDVFIALGISNKDLLDDANKFINKSLEINNSGLITDDLKYYYSIRMNVQIESNLSQLGDFKKKIEYRENIHKYRIVGFLRDIYSYGNSENLSSNFLSREKIKSINDALLESIDMTNFLNYLNETKNIYHSYLKINYLLYYFAVNEINREQFYDLKNEIFNTIRQIDKWEAYTIIDRLIEIILVKLVRTDNCYNKDIFDLSKLFCELNIFPEHAQYQFPTGMFRDLFITALNLKEYDWAENFVNEYSRYLNEEDRENELNYTSGMLSFKRGRYEASLNFFSKVKHEDNLNKINIRFYYILNYIELKAYESARAAIHAFKQFYKNNDEIPESYRSGLPEALKYLSEIIKCEEEGKKIDDFIYNEIHNGKRFYHAIYIRDKMEKLR